MKNPCGPVTYKGFVITPMDDGQFEVSKGLIIYGRYRTGIKARKKIDRLLMITVRG